MAQAADPITLALTGALPFAVTMAAVMAFPAALYQAVNGHILYPCLELTPSSRGKRMMALSSVSQTIRGSEFFRDVLERIIRLLVITRVLPWRQLDLLVRQ